MSHKIAQISDAPQIVELVNSVYRGEQAKSSWSSEASILGGQRTDAIMIREIISSPNSYILVWHDTSDSVMSACAHLSLKQNTAHLGMLSVALEKQKKGLGKIILQESEIFLKQLGAKILEIEVIHCRPELIAFYQRRGFNQTSQTKPFPYGNLKFGKPLREDLFFIVMQKILT